MKSSRVVTTIQIIALMIGVALTLHGISKLSWPNALPWDVDGRFRFGVFLIVTFAFVSLLAWRFRWNAFMAAVLCAVLLAGAGGALGPLLVIFWMAVASAILGRWLLRKMSVEVGNWMAHFLVGAGVYATAVGLLAHFPVNYSGVYAAALALPVVLGRKTLQQWLDAAKRWTTQYRQPDERSSIWLEIAIAVVLLIHFVVALMPEVGFDALATHLFVPVHLATRHQWGFDAATYVWAVIPMLGDWMFSIAYMLGGETAARLINVGFVFVLAWLVRDLVLWAGGTMLGARWAALIFLSTPLTFTESSSLFIESVWASFVVAGAFAVFKACSDEERKTNQLIIAGILLGCSLAAKAVTFMVLPSLLLILVWRYKTWLKPGVAGALIVGLVLFLMLGAVPYVTAWSLTENPVFPFFNKLFHSPLWPAENFEAPAVFGKGVTWDILYRATFHSDKYLEGGVGAAGFQWLLLFLPASITVFLSGRWRGLALIIFGAASVTLTFHETAYLRYIFPAVAVLAAAIGLGMTASYSAGSFRAILWGCVAPVAISLNILFLSAGSVYKDFALTSIFSQSDRERYLAGRLPLRNAVDLVNSLNIERTPVAVLGQPMTAGLASDALYPNWYNHKFQAAINSVNSDQGMVDILLDKKVDFLILDSSWNGTKEQHGLVERVTEKIAEFGVVAVRKIKADYRFKKEMLVNPNLDDTTGWGLIGDARLISQEGTVLVSEVSPAVQITRVSPGRRYLNTVIARCYKEITMGRVQVNWIDANGKFISTNIRTFDCSANWTKHAVEVTAPTNAVNAAVYATGHSKIPLEYKEVSFRQ